jgi:A/G-specific adenine glycosylase
MGSNSRGENRFSFPPQCKPEHKILWSSLAAAKNAKVARGLKGFFNGFARKQRRNFAWRKQRVSPFHLLLAEVLLVQTKAEDVAILWPRLVRKYPTPFALSRAKKASLARLLRPLGLQNQRARSLVAIGKTLCQRFGGRVPRTAEELLSVPHIGLYTAAAVASFAFGVRLPIVDANVLRVLGRIHGIETGADLRRSREAWTLAWTILPRKNARLHNYGLLDFAAQICKVRRPRCESCPLNQMCCFGKRVSSMDAKGALTS